jgi:hypothetical protein
MAFRDITDILGPIALPIKGKTYTLPVLTIEQGIKLHKIMDPKDEATMTDPELYAFLLGEAHAEMAADNVAPEVIARAAFVALADWQSGRPAAEVIWEQGVDPKALMKAIELAEALTSKATDAEHATPQPARTNTTKSRKKPAPTR